MKGLYKRILIDDIDTVCPVCLCDVIPNDGHVIVTSDIIQVTDKQAAVNPDANYFHKQCFKVMAKEYRAK